MSDQNGDTPQSQIPPVTPGSDSDTPPQSSQGAYDPNELEREKARAATAQSELAKTQALLRKERIARLKAEKNSAAQGDGGDGGDGNQADPEAVTTRLQAERGILGLIAMNSQYQNLLSSDPTLREILTTNPLALLKEFIDADDAVEQIKNKLDSRLANSTPGTPNTPAPTTPNNVGVKPASNDINLPHVTPPVNSAKMTMDQASKLSKDDWAKIPADERRRILENNS